MKKYNVCLFGVKETTKMLAEFLYQHGIKVDLIISISPSVTQKNDVANYIDLEPVSIAIGADYYVAKDYSLKHVDDHFFNENEFNVGISYGWQRLIPPMINSQFKQGIFGFHASPGFLPEGRGRSPLNWGIILGKTMLYQHFFRYANDADAGDIYSVTPFEITPHDTILTLIYKSIIIAKKEVPRLLRDLQNGQLPLMSQQGESSFLPKRTPEDGLIYFETSSTEAIVNLIRGVSFPFQGAFCFNSLGKKIIIWEAWAFDKMLDFSSYFPGEVIDNLYGMPIIKTIDGSLLLKKFEGDTLQKNERLYSSKEISIS